MSLRRKGLLGVEEKENIIKEGNDNSVMIWKQRINIYDCSKDEEGVSTGL